MREIKLRKELSLCHKLEFSIPDIFANYEFGFIRSLGNKDFGARDISTDSVTFRVTDN